MSLFGVITAAQLETFTGKDYSEIDSKYTSAYIVGKISAAEQIVDAYRTIDTSDNAMIVAVKILAGNMMHNDMVDDGYAEEKVKVISDDVMNILGFGDEKKSVSSFEIEDLSG